MPFRFDYSLIFHPDPAAYPARRPGEEPGESVVRILRSDYVAPIYLDADLGPGTILLTRPMFGVGAKAIASYQSLVFSSDKVSCWSHVAIVGADGFVWDANPGLDIMARSLSEFLEGVDILHARRVRGREWDLRLLDDVIREQSRATYPQLADRDVTRYLLSYMAGRAEPVPFDRNELICSSFVDRVVREALSIEPFPEDAPPLALPGHFAQSGAFECIRLASNVFRVEGESV